MTKKAQESYVRGFCRTAEAYGVNPAHLMKIASVNGFKRFLGILRNQFGRAGAELRKGVVNPVVDDLKSVRDALGFKITGPKTFYESGFDGLQDIATRLANFGVNLGDSAASRVRKILGY